MDFIAIEGKEEMEKDFYRGRLLQSWEDTWIRIFLSVNLRKAYFFCFPCLKRLALYLGTKLDLSSLVVRMFS